MKATTLLLVVGMCACHKREETTQAAATTAPPVTAETSVVASPAPTETAAASASAAPVASDDVRIARMRALEEAQAVGMIGLLNSGGMDGGAISPWGRDDSLGNDPLSARGNLWGDQIGDAFTAGGLGLRDGGAGGRGEGIGLGTIGHGSGTGTSATGRGYTSSPKVRQGQTTVNGRLPPEVIQRIVRQNFGRFRLCYENGLRSDPKLAGTVATKFVIGTDGSVTSAARDSSTTMADSGVVSCVTRAFSSLSFPQPEGGIVVVVYPVIFAPGD